MTDDKSKLINLDAARKANKVKQATAKGRQGANGMFPPQRTKNIKKSSPKWYLYVQLIIYLVVVAYGMTLCGR